MKRRMASAAAKFLVATVLLAALAGGAMAQSAPAASSSGYKIAVVDRKEVFDEYQKKIDQWATLEQEKKSIEADLNKKFDALKADSEQFDKGRATMAEEQRSQTEAMLAKRMRDLRSEASLKQEEVTKKGERIIKQVTGDINVAIQKIGEEGGYHLILEADTAISSVVYYSNTINITPQVKEYMRTHGGTLTAEAPKPASNEKKVASDGGDKKKR